MIFGADNWQSQEIPRSRSTPQNRPQQQQQQMASSGDSYSGLEQGKVDYYAPSGSVAAPGAMQQQQASDRPPAYATATVAAHATVTPSTGAPIVHATVVEAQPVDDSYGGKR